MATLSFFAGWAWSAALVFATIAIHVLGITLVARLLRRFWTDDIDRGLTFFNTIPGAVTIIVVVAYGLALLHGFEALIWAAVYVKLGAFASGENAMVYSLSAMTTRGSAGFPRGPVWELMGAVEAGDGMLLFGLSTAFLFTVMLRLRTSVLRQGNGPGAREA